MSIEAEFAICCLEEYKNYHKISGKTAIQLFEKFSIIEYLHRHYEALHTASLTYNVQDIDEYIANRSK